jgi:hypothetical protein
MKPFQPTSRQINTQAQLMCCYSVIPFMLLFFTGWVAIGHLLPPLSPNMPATEVAAYFDEHRNRLRLCMMLSMYSTVFLMPFTASIIGQIARIEREGPRVWTYTAIMAGAGNILSFTFPLMFWTVALFRADRAPELVSLANDFAWLPFLGMASPYVALPMCVALAGFGDSSPNPVFPRWYCYFTIVSTVAILPAALVIFFQEGWFAWNNIFGWWLPFADVFGWTLLTFWLVRKGILAQAAENAGGIA